MNRPTLSKRNFSLRFSSSRHAADSLRFLSFSYPVIGFKRELLPVPVDIVLLDWRDLTDAISLASSSGDSCSIQTRNLPLMSYYLTTVCILFIRNRPFEMVSCA